MNIFISGGAGYIGSAAAEAMLKLGHSVTVYDSLVTGYRAAVPDEATFIQGDLADRQQLEARHVWDVEVGGSSPPTPTCRRDFGLGGIVMLEYSWRPSCRATLHLP